MADPITYDDFAKLELRVAKVLEVRPHPNADRLLLLAGRRRRRAKADRRRDSPALHAGAAHRQADRDRQQSPARDAARRDIQRHAAGGNVGREGDRAHRGRPELRRGSEDQVAIEGKRHGVRHDQLSQPVAAESIVVQHRLSRRSENPPALVGLFIFSTAFPTTTPSGSGAPASSGTSPGCPWSW